jgi:hypothetical protein
MQKWIDEEKKFYQIIQQLEIPDCSLEGVPFILAKSIDDFENIPNGGGCYWIWTNEPINHVLHKHHLPQGFDGGEIIYNGIAQDDVKGRAKHHLLGEVDAGWSGVSIDLYLRGDTQSHRKKAMSSRTRSKAPYLSNQPIRTVEQLKQLNLSQDELDYVENNALSEYFFRNGIHILDSKHQPYQYRVYFITGLTSLYLAFIEKQWRQFCGLPRLCSYSSGR